MNDSQGESPKQSAAVSKLGRGLGRLIPVQKTKEFVQTNAADQAPEAATASAVRVTATASSADASATRASRVGSAIQPSGVGSTTETVSQPTGSAFGRLVLQVPITSIRPNARQPRKDFDPASLTELAASIRSAGLLQPIVVRPIVGDKSSYELIAGERRWRACSQLGWTEIPAIVMNATDQNAGVWALIENVHRADLNAMDRAASLKQLASEFRLTHEALAEQVGLDRSSVTNLLRLADLDETTAAFVRKGLITQGHAKALLAVSNLKTRTTLAESTVRGEWTVRALEREVQRLQESNQAQVPRGTTTTRRRTHIDALERKLSQALGTDVSIHSGKKPNTGKLQIAFYSLEQFEGLVSALGIKPSQIRLEE